MKKTIIGILVMVLMVGLVSATTLDYDTFDRDGQPLGVTEGLGNAYDDMSGYTGSLDEVSIANGMAIFNETVGVGYWIYVNQSTSPLNEYTFYMKMKSSLATQYIELIGQEAPHDVGIADSIMSVEGDSVYHFIGQTTTLDSDEWVEMYYYRDGSIHNVTIIGESGNFTYSGAWAYNPFGVWNFYWDSTGGTEAVLLIDEWAICSGYDLTCSPPSGCTPDWVCSGYGDCLENDTQECNAVTDNNSCGEQYSGDYSEFDTQACDYCTPDWQLALYWGACETPEFLQTKIYEDNNFCGEFETQPADINRTCGKSNFAYGDSTDFEQVADPTNVTDAKIETPYGYIHWVNPINIAGYDLDSNVIISDNLLSVNKANLHESMNSESNVAFHMTPRTQEEDTCEKFLLYYSPDFFGSHKDLLKAIAEGKVTLVANHEDIGQDCKDPTICTSIQCSDDTLTFTAQHWSGFGLGDRPYTSGDLAPATFDAIVTFILHFVAFAGLIVIILLGSWAIKTVKKK